MKHRLSALCLTLFFVLCFFPMQGCVRQSSEAAGASGVETLHSGSPLLAGGAAIEPSVYVSLRDGTNHVFGLRSLMERALEARGYAITNTPSRAGYILQITVIHAGEASPAAVRQAVPQGYGKDANVSGQGASALVADVLVAARTLPTSHRSSVLANASRRSTVADEQVRLAVMLSGRDATFSRSHTHLEKGLVDAVVALFPVRQSR